MAVQSTPSLAGLWHPPVIVGCSSDEELVDAFSLVEALFKDLEFEDIDCEELNSRKTIWSTVRHRITWMWKDALVRLRWMRNRMWKDALVWLGLRCRAPSPAERLRDIILIRASRRDAEWVEVSRSDFESPAQVTFGFRGKCVCEAILDAVLEPIVEAFMEWCDVEENFAGAPTYRGAVELHCGDTWALRVRISARRPEGKPSSVFVELYDTGTLEGDTEDDDSGGVGSPDAAAFGGA